MLTDLIIKSIKPSGIMALISQINGEDLNNDNLFKKYTTGVYKHDGYKFNFDYFIIDNTNNEIIDKWIECGVCDNYQQILDKNKELLNDQDKKYVIGLSTVRREDQSEGGGWRWHKWGEYIGNQKPEHEYLYDDTHINKVYCYRIYEVA